MLILPFGVEENITRPGTVYKTVQINDPTTCYTACNVDPQCLSWVLDINNNCNLQSDIGLSSYI